MHVHVYVNACVFAGIHAPVYILVHVHVYVNTCVFAGMCPGLYPDQKSTLGVSPRALFTLVLEKGSSTGLNLAKTG